jgi:hypothetical protein
MSIIYSALLCGAPALEELDLASDFPFVVDSGPDGSNMVSAIAELRVLRLNECYLPANCPLFHHSSNRPGHATHAQPCHPLFSYQRRRWQPSSD